jgi:pyruvate-formate lyase-activating enzyme
MGPHDIVFDLPTRTRDPLDDGIRQDLGKLATLAQPFTLQHVDQVLEDCSGSRSANLVAHGWITDARKVDPVHHYVRNLVLETCTPCTANCVFCPVSTNPRRRPRFMDMALFRLILSRFDGHQLNFVTLNIYNEPLLHPEFLLQAQLLADMGQPLALFTTAAILRPQMADGLAEIGNVDRIVVNCPSADPAEYKRLMGVKMPRDLVVNLKHAIDVGLPLQICVNGLTETAARSQAIISALSDDTTRAPAAFANYTHNRAGAIVGSENIDDPVWTGELRGCRRAVEDVTVNVDGKVLLCCEDFHQDHVLGDLRTHTLDEILSGDRAVAYRRTIFGLEPAPADFICRKCAECWHRQTDFPLPQTKLV